MALSLEVIFASSNKISVLLSGTLDTNQIMQFDVDWYSYASGTQSSIRCHSDKRPTILDYAKQLSSTARINMFYIGSPNFTVSDPYSNGSGGYVIDFNFAEGDGASIAHVETYIPVDCSVYLQDNAIQDIFIDPSKIEFGESYSSFSLRISGSPSSHQSYSLFVEANTLNNDGMGMFWATSDQIQGYDLEDLMNNIVNHMSITNSFDAIGIEVSFSMDGDEALLTFSGINGGVSAAVYAGLSVLTSGEIPPPPFIPQLCTDIENNWFSTRTFIAKNQTTKYRDTQEVTHEQFNALDKSDQMSFRQLDDAHYKYRLSLQKLCPVSISLQNSMKKSCNIYKAQRCTDLGEIAKARIILGLD